MKRRIQDIRRKAETLQRNLSGKRVYENFGEKEQRVLDEYIGSIYDYDYFDRPVVSGIANDFFEWCSTYNG